MTDAHNPKLLSDADMAADLAGLPRPAPAQYMRVLKTRAANGDGDAADTIHALVSERDALAVRVRELADDRDSWRDQCSQRVADWAAEHERVRELEGDARRWRWWMSDAPKDVQTYLYGCRDKWTLEQWNNWADAALASKEQP